MKKTMTKNRNRRGKKTKKSGGPESTAFQAVRVGISGGFPSKAKVCLKYYEYVTVSTSTTQAQVWYGNSVYDPNSTGTGKQPYNYDDWAIQYNRYRVVSSRIQTVFQNSSNVGGVLSVCPTNNSTAPSYDDMCAAPLGKMRIFQPNYSIMTQCVLAATTKSILGEVSGDRLESQVSTTPTDPWFWATRITSPAGTAITGYLHTTIWYEVEFFDRNTLTLDEKQAQHEAVKQIRKTKAMLAGGELKAQTAGETKSFEPVAVASQVAPSKAHSVEPAAVASGTSQHVDTHVTCLCSAVHKTKPKTSV